MVNQADYVGARLRYPEIDKLTQRDWVEFFHERPDVLTKLLGDMYAITKQEESSERRYGKRTRYVNGNLDELWNMLSPRYSTEPFGVAVRELIGAQSLRAFAAKIPMHHYSLTRLIRGERQVVNMGDIPASLATLERIAKAGKVHPAFFREWRALTLLGAFHSAMEAHPNLTITLVSELAR